MTEVGTSPPVTLDESLVNRIHELARALGVASDSFLLSDFAVVDADLLRQIADGLTLAFVTHCYHHHPRGENVYELMALEENRSQHTGSGRARSPYRGSRGCPDSLCGERQSPARRLLPHPLSD